MNIVERVINWNKERGLDKQEFDSNREFGFILEELLEGINIHKDKFYDKKAFREYVKQTLENFKTEFGVTVPNVAEQADAFGDIIVFAIGALLKICNQNPELGTPDELLERIMLANDAKGNKVDADGKIIKDKTFIEPTH